MLNSIQRHIEAISQEQIVNLADFQEVQIVSNKETIRQIKKLSKETGLPVSRVIEAMIKAALEELPAAAEA
ncbi:hypothetical protein Desca_1955 [Desulfotomaculum nigrificans CO-1-SRB]|uniref:Ribbon-helix-helix protein CopG domain-containing protein n=1 Tax=Desulfotomaculum nigrificans (strain DSM 14880 / VKM B-2319 / CO-1-SRB) TaxID=868595 RepID=F6B8V3_DESCC|nr:hypothetical protein [Desulfotomaculum nigrificans]AEF94796.1 hypothetical protein Desca_1955 [Desulfotomaculum nigrificans CO-1-SRB]